MEPIRDFWNVLESRRSVRRFKPAPVPPDVIERLLAAAVRAPNAHNRQSWRFAVLQAPADIERLADGMGVDYRKVMLEGGTPPDQVEARAAGRKARICGAPLVIVAFVDTTDLDSYKDPNRDNGEYMMAVQSAALAGGYLLLAAEALGLGGVWMCAPLFTPERVRELFSLPEFWQAQGMFLLGVPDDEPAYRERRPLDEVIKYL
ncbi:MAG TPA: nitroreductase family protein [Anaerolineales bacterium]|nr:nitroreductase family protein [Anaerolineales bacterium]